MPTTPLREDQTAACVDERLDLTDGEPMNAPAGRVERDMSAPGSQRRWLRRIHLYLGLTAGALFVLMGLTGSVLVFYLQIDSWLHPTIEHVAPTARPPSYEAIYRTLLTAYPQRPASWDIEVPDNGGVISARSEVGGLTAFGRSGPLIVWVDPATLRVLRADQWGHFAMTWIYELHQHLLLGKAGGIILGCFGLLVLVLMITGVLTWWPSHWRDLKYALGARGWGQLRNRLYHIHNLSGLIALAALLVIVATGAMLSPRAQFSTSSAVPAPHSAGHPLLGRLPVDRVVAIAVSRLPAARLKWIHTPAGPNDTYTLRLRVTGDPNHRFPNSTVWIDQHSGRVLAVSDIRRAGPASVFWNWLYPLHDGEALDMPGRIVLLLSGLMPCVLFVTGFWRWLTGRTRRVASS